MREGNACALSPYGQSGAIRSPAASILPRSIIQFKLYVGQIELALPYVLVEA